MPIVENDTERRLLVAMRARPRQTSTELAGVLGVSAQTIRRMFGRMPSGEILATGRTHRARYALRRGLRGTNVDLPVYAIDPQGRGQRLATLALVEPEGTLMALPDTDWPVPEESRDGWWDGLPYPIWSMRPQGYLGRRFAMAEHRDLGVADDPEAWTDDDILWVLSRRGTDTAGNLVLGDEAYRRWLEVKMREEPVLAADGAPAEYARLAGESVTHGRAGSSAAGEFPKFTALRDLDGAMTPHVIVKFSGAGGSGAERRWSDLLVCEHLALIHELPQPPGVPARADERQADRCGDRQVFAEGDELALLGSDHAVNQDQVHRPLDQDVVLIGLVRHAVALPRAVYRRPGAFAVRPPHPSPRPRHIGRSFLAP